MNQHEQYRLDFVLMPMVKMLAEQNLSWSQREQVAHAMLATMQHHKELTGEMHVHAAARQECQGMEIGAGLARGEIAAMMREQRASRITPAPD